MAATNGATEADLAKLSLNDARAQHSVDPSADALVAALSAAKRKDKPLIRSTAHTITSGGASSGGAGSDAVPAKEGEVMHVLHSWKTAEFAYRKSGNVGSELLTLARGLFTEQVADKHHRIAVRGYDKFFNIGEMAWTKPASIKEFSSPPYELTFKENGCIIFIAALSPRTLVVTSKHSLGELAAVEITHAQKGEEWLDRHLKTAGRTREELAQELWKRGETAVAELCDDSFEEHVLAYPPEKSGLHLHGLNANKSAFSTRPMTEVDTFARAWGFLPTRWIVLNDLAEVERFTDKVGTTGSWDGEAIEGFVVRTSMPPAGATVYQDVGPSNHGGRERLQRPPYEPGQRWFYKVKFDEPYMMYRDWRELTKRMLNEQKKWEKEHGASARARRENLLASAPDAGSAKKPDVNVPGADLKENGAGQGEEADGEKSKNALKKERKKVEAAAKRAEVLAHKAAGIKPPEPIKPRSNRPETLLFVRWCHARIYGSSDGKVRPQPELFARFNHGKGIIALRDAFVEYMKTDEGAERLRALGGTIRGVQRDERPFGKTVIVPIAVPGCGKTALAIALRELFGFGHTQSDDVTAKKTGPTFLKNIVAELGKHDVVIADRNNHLFKHRTEIDEAVKRYASQPGSPRVRLVALAWSLDSLPLNTIHRICADRILARGGNHQSLRADEAASRAHETILWRFLEGLEAFGSAPHGEGAEGAADEAFDETLWMDVDAGIEWNVRKAVSGLAPILSLTQPSEERIREALEAVSAYRVELRKESKEDVKAGTDVAGKNATKPRYYGIAVELDIEAILAPFFDAHAEDLPDGLEFFEKLSRAGRVATRPHLTLVHSASVATEAKARAENAVIPPDAQGAARRWARYEEMCGQPGPGVEFVLTLDRVAWDDRVMALGVHGVHASDPTTIPEFEELQGGTGGREEGSWRPHVTVGTADEGIKAFEAGALLRKADRDADEQRKESRWTMLDPGVTVKGRLKGLF